MKLGYCSKIESFFQGTIFLAVATCLSLSGSLVHANNVYMCIGPGGVPEYKNSGSVKGCRKLDIQAQLTISAPSTPSIRPSQTFRDPAGLSPRGARNPGYIPPVIPAGMSKFSNGSDFPSISRSQQQQRDISRSRILQAELQQERNRLNQLLADYNNGQPERYGDERNYQKYLDRTQDMRENILRAQANINAIEKEMRLGN